MSLATAFNVLIAEIFLTTLVIAFSATPAKRATRIINLFGVFSGLTFLWAFGLAGADEANEYSGISSGTIITFLLLALNAAVFVTAHKARERIKYGSAPTSQ